MLPLSYKTKIGCTHPGNPHAYPILPTYKKQNNKMKLSIIVPVYKARRHLQKCIESILQQTYTDYELILVDDGSPDGCGAICDRYAQECDKVKVIHKKNGGLSSARNAGISAARGEYITFVDADDIIAGGTYYYNMRILASNPDVDILEYPIVQHYETPHSKIISFTPEKISGNSHIFPDWIRRKGYEHCFACNKIYRAELFFFIRYPEGEVFEDTLVTPQLISSCETIYYSDGGFYYYYDQPESITNNHTFRSHSFLYRNLVSLYNKVKKEYGMHNEANTILLRCVENLTDLYRCSGGPKEEYCKAGNMLKGEKIGLSELYGMELPMKKKIKFTLFALFGASFHSRILAIFHKKLC